MNTPADEYGKADAIKFKHDVVLNVRSKVASDINYQHKLCLEVSILVSSGMIAIGTFGLDRSSAPLSVRIALILGFLIAAVGASWLIIRISVLVQELREILVRLDTFNELFTADSYLTGVSIYPKSWESVDAARMDLVPKWSLSLIVVTGLAMSALSLVRT
ncbi:MAG: hypothetical protein K0M70_02655 [Arenimonas sp.]|uniref:hypothetical protein n=1 Tax=Arenimonas sp. TaxID=1872635 RepID=UPI0025BA965F|nr:hypothetical protein [Arenimonas sp.]MBW8366741.1 hypothetical protein [Arenimonas sp.]